jgi:hypothetical protein
LLGLLFDPEDGGGIFFRKVRLSPNYTALQIKDRTPELHPRLSDKKFAEFNYLLFVIAALVQLTLFRTLLEEAQDVFTLLGGDAAPYDGYFYPFRWKLG